MATSDVQAVLSNPVAFEALVAQLLSADNQARKDAEAVYEQLKSHPDACVSHLIRTLRQSPNVQHRGFCAIMLRKAVGQGEPTMYEGCNPQVQAAVRSELLAALGQETERTVIKKVCDTISELGSELMEDSGATTWPELLPFLQTLISSQQAAPMESALSIIASLATYCAAALRIALGTVLHPLLAACLGPPCSVDVQMAAFRCAAAFVTGLEEPKAREPFQALVPAMLAVLGRALQADDEASAQEALELLIEVADTHPKFLRRSLPDVVDAMLQVATAAQLEGSTRGLAAEFLVTLAEARDKAPGMVRKLPDFTGRLFTALMGFLLDLEDDPLWYKADSDQHEEEGHGELFDSGQEFLDRVAIALGGKSLVPAAAALLPLWLRDADWRKRHAALICLAQIAEGCSKVMLEQVAVLVDMCLAGLQDPHPKVRWASCQALGQMCTDLGPELQERCGGRLLPALMTAMEDFAYPRVQAHASAAIVNFSESCDASMMGPHLDALITRLLALLQRGERLVQEGALTAVASVADCAQATFIKYYDAVMPPLSHILLGAQDKQHRLLRAKALECISLVGMAVGRERFRADATHVMTFLQQLQASELEADDPTASYMLQAGARLCKCLGPEFLPYLAVVMPPLLRTAAQEPEMKVRSPDDDFDEDDDDVEHVSLGDKVLSIRTSSLEDKVTATNMICCYAEELKGGFFPYVQQVLEIMVPLLRFYFHEDVRRGAVQALPQLLSSAISAAEAGAPGADAAFIKGVVDFVWEPLMVAIRKEPDMDVQAAMLEALVELVDLIEPGQLGQQQVEAAFKELDVCLAAAEQRRAARAQRAQAAGEDFDEEEAEALEAENEAEEEVYDQVGNAIGSFLKKYGDAALPYVEGLMPRVAPLLDKQRSHEDRRIGLCIVDDLLEHSPAGRAKYAVQVLPHLLDACLAAHADLRQCAAYGLGVIAGRSPDLFRPHVAAALQRLLPILQHPEARSEENEMATDNAAAALGRILEHHAEAAAAEPAAASAWVAALPLRSDTLEALPAHELLVRLLEAQDPRVLGPGGQHVPHLVGAMVTVLGRGTELVAPEVGLRMAALLQRLQQAAPAAADAAAAAFARLNAKQQASLQAYVGGSAPQSSEPAPFVARRSTLAALAAIALLHERKALAVDTMELEGQLPTDLPPPPSLPPAYLATVDRLISALRVSLQAEASGAGEFEVRRKADPVKEPVKEFVGRWRDDPAVLGDPTHTAIKDALARLGAFYQREGPRARLSDDVRTAILALLDEAEAALPSPRKRGSILGL